MPQSRVHHLLWQMIWPGAMLALLVLPPKPARADVFDGMRRTFQTDIPHFFQDDIPCAFGGQPTSHTRASCNGTEARKRPAAKAPVRSVVPADQRR